MYVNDEVICVETHKRLNLSVVLERILSSDLLLPPPTPDHPSPPHNIPIQISLFCLYHTFYMYLLYL